MDEPLSYVEREDWDGLLEASFDAPGLVREEMRAILDERGEELLAMRSATNERATEERVERMRGAFPLFHDRSTRPRRFEEYDALVPAVLVAWYVEATLDRYLDELAAAVDRLETFLDGGETAKGEYHYQRLRAGRTTPRERDDRLLREAADRLERELAVYDDENESFEDRDIDETGLTVVDAVKCLHDFEGRTLPFLKAVCERASSETRVLELGVGTGVLSFAAGIAGAKEVVGLELNPLTCLLARTIRDDLKETNLLREANSVTILWGDAREFGVLDHLDHADDTFDLVISENIYTGMFYEAQMNIVERVMENGLVPTHEVLQNGFHITTTDADLVPRALASAAELVELDAAVGDVAAATRLDLAERGVEVDRRLTGTHVYDQIDFTEWNPTSVKTVIRFTAREAGTVHALNLHSVVKLADGHYIGRNENEFLNDDHLLLLDDPFEVDAGEQVVVGLAYTDGADVRDALLEARRVGENRAVDDDYVARLNVPERRHRRNFLRFRDANEIRQPIDLSDIGDGVRLETASYYDGYERPWLTDLLDAGPEGT